MSSGFTGPGSTGLDAEEGVVVLLAFRGSGNVKVWDV